MHSLPCRFPRRVGYYLAFTLAQFVLVPASAHANSGTPLMILNYLHLWGGNILIGLGEAALLGIVFRKMWRPMAWRMVLANYASMLAGYGIAGLLFLAPRLVPEIPPLELARPMILIGIVVAFAVTVLVEWPFVAWALGSWKNRDKVALKASLLVQAASYAIIVPLYVSASPTTLATGTRVRSTTEIAHPARGVVYFLGAKDNALWKVGTNGMGLIRVAKRIDDQYLWVKPSEKPGWAALWSATEAVDGSVTSSSVLPSLGPAWAFARVEQEAPEPPAFQWRSGDFRHMDEGYASVQTGFWASEGLSVRYADGTSERFAMETPFMAWPARSATVLPEDQVVFQAGDQILILDLTTREIACIARGSSPIVRLLPREGP